MGRKIGRMAATMAMIGGLAACVTDGTPPEAFLARYGVEPPHPDRFRVCYNFGCRQSALVELQPGSWEKVRAHFAVPASSAAEERTQVAAAVAHLERLTAPYGGFVLDVGENEWPDHGSNQLDCIDESINTTAYLLMFQQDGLLAHHTVRYPEGRILPKFYPHNTAVLVERGTQTAYAIDTWFFPNGELPEIVELNEWEAGFWPQPRAQQEAAAE